jgi:hypothetical protein
MSFSPQLFLSNINSKDGLAKSNRFEVILPIPRIVNENISQSLIEKLLNLPNNVIADVTEVIKQSQPENEQNRSLIRYLSLQCEAAELPGKTIITENAKVYGPIFRVPYQTQFTETNLTFLCTNEFYERKLFEKWMDCIMPLDTNNLRFPKDYESRYLTNIKIIQYDEFIRQIFAIELVDAFPIGISSQPVSWSEEGFHRITIQFAYQKYKVLYQGNYDLLRAATSIFGEKFSRLLNRTAADVTAPVGRIFNIIT